MQQITAEHPCRIVISIKSLCSVIEIPLKCSPVNFLHFFKAPFYKNTYGGLFYYENRFHENFKLFDCVTFSCPPSF